MKRLLILIPTVILLILLALGAWLALFFDANDYRDQISSKFKNATGYEIIISGELNTSFFPWIGIQTGAIEVSSPPGFGDVPLAGVQAAKIKLKIIPLLIGRIEMGTVVLEGVQANLITLENGQKNWKLNDAGPANESDMGRLYSMKSYGSAGTKNRQPTKQAGNGRAVLAIGGVEMTNANIVWDDRQAGTKIELTKMNLQSGTISYDSPFSVTLDTNFALNSEEMKGDMSVETDLVLSKSLKISNLNDFSIQIVATGTALKDGRLQQSLRADILIDQAARTISSDKVVLELYLTGELAPINPMEVAIQSPLKVNLGNKVIELPAMQYSIPGSVGTGSMVLSNLNNPLPTVKLKVETDKFDATPWMGNGASQSTMNATTMEQMLLSIVSIHSASASSNSAPTTLPVEKIRQLDVDADMTIGTFILDTLQATDVKAVLKANNGVVRIEPMSANLFGGSSTGMFELDARSAIAKIHITEDLNNVQIDEVMKVSMAENYKQWITGTADMQADIRTQGLDKIAMTQALNGTVNAKVKDGAFEGISLRKLLRKTNALLKKEAYVDDGSPDRTEILKMGTTTNIVNGVAKTNDIKLQTPLVELTGTGAANLNTRQLDYNLKLALSSDISEEDKAEFKKLEGRSLPLKISGNFDNPKFNISLDEVTKQEIKNKAESKLRKKYGKKYGKELDLLFGR